MVSNHCSWSFSWIRSHESSIPKSPGRNAESRVAKTFSCCCPEMSHPEGVPKNNYRASIFLDVERSIFESNSLANSLGCVEIQDRSSIKTGDLCRNQISFPECAPSLIFNRVLLIRCCCRVQLRFESRAPLKLRYPWGMESSNQISKSADEYKGIATARTHPLLGLKQCMS